VKKKIVLSSIATIALCLCLIAGSTFALFTGNSTVNVAVTSGKVKVAASIDEASFAGESIGVDAIKDNNGVLYFANGGTATLNGAVVTLDLVTPGDFVNLTVKGVNSSDVAIKYRYVVELKEACVLASAITVQADGVSYDLGSDGKTYLAPTWTEFDASEGMKSVTITIGMDKAVGNTDADGNSYHNQTAEFIIRLEAVQANGVDQNGNLVA